MLKNYGWSCYGVKRKENLLGKEALIANQGDYFFKRQESYLLEAKKLIEVRGSILDLIQKESSEKSGGKSGYFFIHMEDHNETTVFVFRFSLSGFSN